MSLSPTDVQIPLWTTTHIHLRSKAASTSASASAPSILQKDNYDWLSVELRDGRIKIPAPKLREDGSRGLSVANFLSTYFLFRGSETVVGGMYLSYSVVPKEKEDFDPCRICRLFSRLAKKRQRLSVRLKPRRRRVSLRPQASTTSMDSESVMNCHLLQLNFINSQFMENNIVYSVCSRKMYREMSRLHRMLDTE